MDHSKGHRVRAGHTFGVIVGMLAAMPTASSRPPSADAPRSRDRDDACPGALRLHIADDGALARVRVPGGVLSVRQAEALAEASARMGDSDLHLTSRGNVQLRGLEPGSAGELSSVLARAGLLPSARHDRIRNIVASPLSGLDGQGAADVGDWLRDLDAMLCASEATRALSGRFLFALDDGRGDMTELDADITLRAAGPRTAWLLIGAHALAVPRRTAPRAALIAAEAFTRKASGSAWRVSDVKGAAEGLVEAVQHALRADGVATVRSQEVPGSAAAGPAPGVLSGPGTTTSLSVLAPLGRLSTDQWDQLVRLASATGRAELRLTPWRGVVLPGVAARELPVLEAAGLITAPDDPWAGVGACIGRPGCAKAAADVRKDAATVLGQSGGLPVYWSGCERRCGHPRGDHVDVVASPTGYQISVAHGGQCLDHARTVLSEVAAAVAAARTQNANG